MKLIDLTYFENEMKLPNLETDPVNNDVINDNDYVGSLISRCELKFLTRALGLGLARDLLNQIDSNGDVKPSADQRWKDLIGGKGAWMGLRYELGGENHSMVANYTYCQYLFDLSKGNLSTLGVSNDAIEKSTVISPVFKYVDKWNNMVLQYQDGSNCFPYAENDLGMTLESYLRDNADDFPGYYFKYFKFENQHGL